MNTYIKSDNVILHDIGKKIKEVRLEQNITQQQLSELSGVSKRSIGNIENGLNHSVMAMIAILRALSILDYLDRFFEEKKISPLEFAKLIENRKVRKQAKRRKENKNDEIEW